MKEKRRGAQCAPPACMVPEHHSLNKVNPIQYGLFFKHNSMGGHYDVIIGNIEGFVILLFIKVEEQNLADWGILMCTFKKLSTF